VTGRLVPGLDVAGPVQAEIFVVFHTDEPAVMLTGPCGADPWHVEVAADEDPMVVVATMVARVIGDPIVVHSTSWRRDRGGVILSFLAVIKPDQVGEMTSVALGRTDLARGGATSAPAAVAGAQVVEHALRHLAWLAKDDPVVAERLDTGWHQLLSRYVPEPFRHL
jgi:hypothetical protein